MLPHGLNWLCYFAGNSKSHRENSISFIFLESPHQLDMKNVVKCLKHFFGYFNALKTHGANEQALFMCIINWIFWIILKLRNFLLSWVSRTHLERLWEQNYEWFLSWLFVVLKILCTKFQFLSE